MANTVRLTFDNVEQSEDVLVDTPTFASVAQNTTAVQSVALDAIFGGVATSPGKGGINIGDICILVDDGGIQAGLFAMCLPVTVAGQVNFKFANVTAGALTPTPTRPMMIRHVRSNANAAAQTPSGSGQTFTSTLNVSAI